MKKIYQLTLECGDPWARYTSVACCSHNKKQLEDLAVKINKIDKEADASVHELVVKDSLTSADYKEIMRYYGYDL